MHDIYMMKRHCDKESADAVGVASGDPSFGDPVAAAYAEMETVLTKSNRTGLKRLTKDQLHRKMGHR